MSRCPRCNSCQSQWDAKPCDHCGWPRAEQRTVLAILQELQSEINEEIDGGEECYGRDILMTRWITQLDSAIEKMRKIDNA